MKTPLKYSFLLAATGFAGLVSQTHAASTLVLAKQVDLSSADAPAGSPNFNISVNSAYKGYKGTANDSSVNLVKTDEVFINPITAYRFWNNPTESTIGTLAQDGGVISDLTTTDVTFQSRHFPRIWESTTPNGNAFSSTADYSSDTAIGNLDEGATGSVDITGMSAGSIYLFYGAYRSTASLNISMTGSSSAGDMTIAELHNGDRSNNDEFYMARVDFVNEEGFASLDYGIESGFNGRFVGVVVTSGAAPQPTNITEASTATETTVANTTAPEPNTHSAPSSTALLGIGEITLILRSH